MDAERLKQLAERLEAVYGPIEEAARYRPDTDKPDDPDWRIVEAEFLALLEDLANMKRDDSMWRMIKRFLDSKG